jgi:hypothetical protein
MHLTASLLLIASVGGALAKHSSYPRLAPKIQRIARQLPDSGLHARQDCPGQSCGTGCIDIGDVCCDVMVGNYCTAGETCNTDGSCCPVGQICSFDNLDLDDITSDDDDDDDNDGDEDGFSDEDIENCGIDESLCGSGTSVSDDCYLHLPLAVNCRRC